LPKPEKTRDVIAKIFGVGHSTVQRADQFVESLDTADAVSAGFKDAVRSGSIKAPKYVIQEIRNIPEAQLPAAVEAIKSGDIIGVMPKSETTRLLVEQAVSQLRATSTALAALKHEMQSLASMLPEYPAVMDMFGVGPTLGPQLIAEIGDVRRFYSKKALVAYAGLDAPPNDSGDVTGRHKSMSKIGASSLRRTLFLVMSVYLQNAPLDESVYQFMDKKRAEGKPYRVYMMASANKFLRIYYATVKAYLESLEHTA